jgi:glycosyltransferase involved in cell wall biosynthesis
MANHAAKLTATENFDGVVASTIDTVEYVRFLPTRTKILEEHNSMTRWMQDNYQKQKSPLRRAREWLTFVKVRRYEKKLYGYFDACTMVSELDRDTVIHSLHYPLPIAVVPNGVDLNYYAPNGFTPQPNTMIFNGSLTYSVNREAVTYFADEILPLIRQQSPEARLMVTGRIDNVPLNGSLRTPGLTLTGYLDDMRPAMAQAAVCVAPIRMGGGTRLKILEAMAMGTPVVATTKGAEGLDVTNGKNILLADVPTDFADRVLTLLNDSALRERLSVNGRRLVESTYDWNSIGDQFECFIQKIVERRPS